VELADKPAEEAQAAEHCVAPDRQEKTPASLVNTGVEPVEKVNISSHSSKI